MKEKIFEMLIVFVCVGITTLITTILRKKGSKEETKNYHMDYLELFSSFFITIVDYILKSTIHKNK